MPMAASCSDTWKTASSSLSRRCSLVLISILSLALCLTEDEPELPHFSYCLVIGLLGEEFQLESDFLWECRCEVEA